MRKLMLTTLALIVMMPALGCSDDDNPLTTSDDPFPLRGTYTWTFDIPNYGTQVSTNIFSEDAVEYDMKGNAYSTHYMMHMESYDAEEGRWVGHTRNDIYYVMFFKDMTDTSVTIFKHKGEDREEAYAFPYPAADATDDHGWNEYVLQSAGN